MYIDQRTVRVFYRCCLITTPAVVVGGVVWYDKSDGTGFFTQQRYRQERVQEAERYNRIINRRRKAIEILAENYERQARPMRYRRKWAKWAQRNHPDPEYKLVWKGDWWEPGHKEKRREQQIERIYDDH